MLISVDVFSPSKLLDNAAHGAQVPGSTQSLFLFFLRAEVTIWKATSVGALTFIYQLHGRNISSVFWMIVSVEESKQKHLAEQALPLDCTIALPFDCLRVKATISAKCHWQGCLLRLPSTGGAPYKVINPKYGRIPSLQLEK